jgi:hypothetical protein
MSSISASFPVLDPATISPEFSTVEVSIQNPSTHAVGARQEHRTAQSKDQEQSGTDSEVKEQGIKESIRSHGVIGDRRRSTRNPNEGVRYVILQTCYRSVLFFAAVMIKVLNSELSLFYSIAANSQQFFFLLLKLCMFSIK